MQEISESTCPQNRKKNLREYILDQVHHKSYSCKTHLEERT